MGRECHANHTQFNKDSKLVLQYSDNTGRDADPSLPSSALVNKEESYISNSPYGPYGLYRATMPVQRWCTLYFTLQTTAYRVYNTYDHSKSTAQCFTHTHTHTHTHTPHTHTHPTHTPHTHTNTPHTHTHTTHTTHTHKHTHKHTHHTHTPHTHTHKHTTHTHTTHTQTHTPHKARRRLLRWTVRKSWTPTAGIG